MLTTWTPAHMPEKEEIKTRLQTARSQLYDFQMKIKEHKIPVIVLFEGWGSSGKGSTIGKVIKNIDPRFFKVATMSAPTAEELRYPFLYRYFKQIPEAGKFTFLDSGWMEQTCKDCLSGEIEGEGYTQRIDSIRRFERQLTDNGYLVLKFFFHIRIPFISTLALPNLIHLQTSLPIIRSQRLISPVMIFLKTVNMATLSMQFFTC